MKTFIIPNVHIQERGGKVIFGQEKTQGMGRQLKCFQLLLQITIQAMPAE